MDAEESKTDETINFAGFQANLRIARNVELLNPQCPFWIGFVAQSDRVEDDSAHYSALQTPQAILTRASQYGLTDCSKAVFSNSIPKPWLIHLTKIFDPDNVNEIPWIHQVIELVNEWNPQAVGFAFPFHLFPKDLKPDNKEHFELFCQFNRLIIKIIYGLSHSSLVRDYYIFAGNQGSDLVLNYLLELKIQLQKAKISSFVYH